MYRPVTLGGSTHAALTKRDDGALLVRSVEPLDAYPRKLTECLERWASSTPHAVVAAKRGADGEWRRITYGDTLKSVRNIAQGLLARRLSPEHPIAILSGNDLEHLQLSLGAMWAGIPFCPISPGYSLQSGDFDKLRHAIGLLTPGLVFVSTADYAPAIAAAVPADVEIVIGAPASAAEGALEGRAATAFDDLAATPAGAQADAANAAVGPETIAKFLFTSGSTKQPKAVITTQRMLCSNQQMILQCLRFLGEEPPVLLDWLPWSHTFGGSHNVGMVLYNGGTLYIDDGKPTPRFFAQTLRNLREIAPSVYFNVPRGWEDLVGALESDAGLRARFFSRVKLLFYSGAGLSQSVWDRLDRLALNAIGMRIRMITGLGMTETSPASLFTTGPEVRSGYVGLPAPGCETKLVPVNGKLEARYRGPHVMPGYWRDPDQSRAAFDAEGFYCTGDALRLVDPDRPALGLFFDGRMTEDFKLATGTFVSVGPLLHEFIAQGAPYVANAVLTGLNRNDIGVLIFPREDTCRALAGSDIGSPMHEVVKAQRVRDFFQTLLDRLARRASGSSTRIGRALIVAELPSFDHGEITDKGSINQRAILTRRTALIDAMYGEAGTPGADPGTLIARAEV